MFFLASLFVSLGFMENVVCLWFRALHSIFIGKNVYLLTRYMFRLFLEYFMDMFSLYMSSKIGNVSLIRYVVRVKKK